MASIAVPIDPSPQALPDSQIMPVSVSVMLNRPSNTKLISGSPDGMTTGETFVPGTLPEPVKPCSPTPSTRADDPYLTYSQPVKQKKPTNESLPTPKSRAADVAKAECARARTSQGKASSASKRKLIVERGSRS